LLCVPRATSPVRHIVLRATRWLVGGSTVTERKDTEHLIANDGPLQIRPLVWTVDCACGWSGKMYTSRTDAVTAFRFHREMMEQQT